MVMLEVVNSWRENGHVSEVASLKEEERLIPRWPVIEGEWSCYGGGQCNRGSMIVKGGQFNGGRMVMLWTWPV